MRSLQRNIRWFKLYIFFNRLDMWQPVVVLFLLERGFTLTEYAVVDAVWYISTVIFEVPTGLLTDRYGKKPSLGVAKTETNLVHVNWMMHRTANWPLTAG